MNDRIRQLAEQAGIGYGNLSTGHGDNWQFAGRPEELERFAQLIVRECADLCDRYQEIPATEPRHCANDIRRKFGVEE